MPLENGREMHCAKSACLETKKNRPPSAFNDSAPGRPSKLSAKVHDHLTYVMFGCVVHSAYNCCWLGILIRNVKQLLYIRGILSSNCINVWIFRDTEKSYGQLIYVRFTPDLFCTLMQKPTEWWVTCGNQCDTRIKASVKLRIRMHSPHWRSLSAVCR